MIDRANADLLLTTTRAVRRRLDLTRPVPIPLIEECIEIALQAPTGGNRQFWRWMIVTDQAKRNAIADLYRKDFATYIPKAAKAYDPDDPRQVAHREIQDSAAYLAEHFHEVPALVIPFYEGRLDGARLVYAGMAFGSVLPATWSFMLAARARGLGTAWTTLTQFSPGELNEVVGAPEDFTHCAVVPVAYYLGDTFRPGRRLPAADVTFHDTWGER